MTSVGIPVEVLETVAGLRGDDDRRGGPVKPGEESLGSVLPRFVEQVHLVDDHDGAPLEELRAERAELTPNVSSATGHASGPSPPSSTYSSSAVRSMCARKRCPSPAPSLAPSMRPGMSAMTAVPSPMYSTPRFGSMVVNG